MEARNVAITLSVVILACTMSIADSEAAKRPPSNVPPTLEIEVLDPGVDKTGNPAVRWKDNGGDELEIDIPPAILVHRFYYTGDRSFQAQILPGGPSIVVANHPKTGERCYIPVQMLPGAPRVTYTKNKIQYDYGDHGITVYFGLLGKPSVKFRSGPTLHQRAANAVHAEKVKQSAHVVARGTANTATAAYGCMHNFARGVGTPIVQTISVMPFGKAIIATDWKQRIVVNAAELKRQKEINHAQKKARVDDFTRRTIR